MPNSARFHIDDIVVWNTEHFSELLPDMKRKYGEGPFYVVAVRLHTLSARRSLPQAHPEAVTIEVKNGQRQEFSGDWFLKSDASKKL